MSLEGAKFVCLDEAGNHGDTVVAKGRKFTMGYYVSCDFVLVDERAKGIHCEIECDAFGRVTIRNLSSEEPILVNGSTVLIKRILLNNSKISILGKDYLWLLPKNSSNEFEDLPCDSISTPQKQIGIPEQPPNSCPDFKPHRELSKRFTIHNFAYCIPSDEEGNTTSDTNSESNTNETDTNKNPPESLTKENEVADSNENILQDKYDKNIKDNRSVTPEPKIGNETYSTPVLIETPKINLINCTEDRENKNSVKNKSKQILTLFNQSDVVITSFSPRETGVKIEKSFTAILKPKVLVTKPPITAKSFYSTPKSTLNENDGEDSERDLLLFYTPSTSKKGSSTASKVLKNSSMHLLDLTIPNKSKIGSPFIKSGSKPSLKKNLTKDIDNSGKLSSDDQLVLSALPSTPILSDDNNTSETPNSVISISSTDASSVMEVLTDGSNMSATPSSAYGLITPSKPHSRSGACTPKRSPQSLMKRALLTSAKKQTTTPLKNINSPTTTPRRECINRIPLRSNIALLRSPITPQISTVDKGSLEMYKRYSMSTPTRKINSARYRFDNSPSTSNLTPSSPSTSFTKVSRRYSTNPISAAKALPTSTPMCSNNSSLKCRSASKTSPLHKVRKSYGGIPLSSHISKGRSIALPASTSKITSIKEKSPQQTISDRLVSRARRSLLPWARNMVIAHKKTPQPTCSSSILKDTTHSTKKTIEQRKAVLFADEQLTKTDDLNRTFVIDSDEEENAVDKKIQSNIKALPENEKLVDTEKLLKRANSPEKLPKKVSNEEKKEAIEIPVDVEEITFESVKKNNEGKGIYIQERSSEDDISDNKIPVAVTDNNKTEVTKEGFADIVSVSEKTIEGDIIDSEEKSSHFENQENFAETIDISKGIPEEKMGTEITDKNKDIAEMVKESTKDFVQTSIYCSSNRTEVLDTGFGEESHVEIVENVAVTKNVNEKDFANDRNTQAQVEVISDAGLKKRNANLESTRIEEEISKKPDNEEETAPKHPVVDNMDVDHDSLGNKPVYEDITLEDSAEEIYEKKQPLYEDITLEGSVLDENNDKENIEAIASISVEQSADSNEAFVEICNKQQCSEVLSSTLDYSEKRIDDGHKQVSPTIEVSNVTQQENTPIVENSNLIKFNYNISKPSETSEVKQIEDQGKNEQHKDNIETVEDLDRTKTFTASSKFLLYHNDVEDDMENTSKLLEEIEDVLNKSDEIKQKHLIGLEDGDKENDKRLTGKIENEMPIQESGFSQTSEKIILENKTEVDEQVEAKNVNQETKLSESISVGPESQNQVIIQDETSSKNQQLEKSTLHTDKGSVTESSHINELSENSAEILTLQGAVVVSDTHYQESVEKTECKLNVIPENCSQNAMEKSSYQEQQIDSQGNTLEIETQSEENVNESDAIIQTNVEKAPTFTPRRSTRRPSQSYDIQLTSTETSFTPRRSSRLASTTTGCISTYTPTSRTRRASSSDITLTPKRITYRRVSVDDELQNPISTSRAKTPRKQIEQSTIILEELDELKNSIIIEDEVEESTENKVVCKEKQDAQIVIESEVKPVDTTSISGEEPMTSEVVLNYEDREADNAEMVGKEVISTDNSNPYHERVNIFNTVEEEQTNERNISIPTEMITTDSIVVENLVKCEHNEIAIAEALENPVKGNVLHSNETQEVLTKIDKSNSKNTDMECIIIEDDSSDSEKEISKKEKEENSIQEDKAQSGSDFGDNTAGDSIDENSEILKETNKEKTSGNNENKVSSKSPVLTGMRELLKTPKGDISTPKFIGIRNLVRTPHVTKQNEEDEADNLACVADLVKTPQKAYTANVEITNKADNVATKTNKSIQMFSDSPQTPVMVGMRELLNTPKAKVETPRLAGIRDLLRTPKLNRESEREEIEKLATVADLLKTPHTNVADKKKEVEKPTNECYSTPNFASTPTQISSTPQMGGVIELLDTPIPQNENVIENTSTKVLDVKELPKTPKLCNKPCMEALSSTPLMGKMKELLNTPAVPNDCEIECTSDNLKVMKNADSEEIGPDSSKNMNAKGANELVETLKCNTPHLKNFRELMHTPKVSSTPLMEGIKELLDSPMQQKDHGLDKFLITPTAKNIMIPTMPSSAVIERTGDSIEVSTEYDLNASNEGETSKLEDIFKTTMESEFVDRITSSYYSEEGDKHDDTTESCDKTKKESVKDILNTSAEEAFDKLTGQETQILTPIRNVYTRKTLALQVPHTLSPFTAADVLSDMPKTDVEEWIETLAEAEPPAVLESDDDGNAGVVLNISSENLKENPDVSTLEHTLTEKDKRNITANDSFIPETCTKIYLSENTITNVSEASLMNTQLKDPLANTATKLKGTETRSLSSMEAEISGINLLDQTLDSVEDEQPSVLNEPLALDDHSMLGEPLVVSDDDESEVNNDTSNRAIIKEKEEDTTQLNLEVSEDDVNELSEPLLVSDSEDLNQSQELDTTEAIIKTNNETESRKNSADELQIPIICENVKENSVLTNALNLDEDPLENTDLTKQETSKEVIILKDVENEKAEIVEVNVIRDEFSADDTEVTKSEIETNVPVDLKEETECVLLENSSNKVEDIENVLEVSENMMVAEPSMKPSKTSIGKQQDSEISGKSADNDIEINETDNKATAERASEQSDILVDTSVTEIFEETNVSADNIDVVNKYNKNSEITAPSDAICQQRDHDCIDMSESSCAVENTNIDESFADEASTIANDAEIDVAIKDNMESADSNSVNNISIEKEISKDEVVIKEMNASDNKCLQLSSKNNKDADEEKTEVHEIEVVNEDGTVVSTKLEIESIKEIHDSKIELKTRIGTEEIESEGKIVVDKKAEKIVDKPNSSKQCVEEQNKNETSVIKQEFVTDSTEMQIETSNTSVTEQEVEIKASEKLSATETEVVKSILIKDESAAISIQTDTKEQSITSNNKETKIESSLGEQETGAFEQQIELETESAGVDASTTEEEFLKISDKETESRTASNKKETKIESSLREQETGASEQKIEMETESTVVDASTTEEEFLNISNEEESITASNNKETKIESRLREEEAEVSERKIEMEMGSTALDALATEQEFLKISDETSDITIVEEENATASNETEIEILQAKQKTGVETELEKISTNQEFLRTSDETSGIARIDAAISSETKIVIQPSETLTSDHESLTTSDKIGIESKQTDILTSEQEFITFSDIAVVEETTLATSNETEIEFKQRETPPTDVNSVTTEIEVGSKPSEAPPNEDKTVAYSIQCQTKSSDITSIIEQESPTTSTVLIDRDNSILLKETVTFSEFGKEPEAFTQDTSLPDSTVILNVDEPLKQEASGPDAMAHLQDQDQIESISNIVDKNTTSHNEQNLLVSEETQELLKINKTEKADLNKLEIAKCSTNIQTTTENKLQLNQSEKLQIITESPKSIESHKEIIKSYDFEVIINDRDPQRQEVSSLNLVEPSTEKMSIDLHTRKRSPSSEISDTILGNPNTKYTKLDIETENQETLLYDQCKKSAQEESHPLEENEVIESKQNTISTTQRKHTISENSQESKDDNEVKQEADDLPHISKEIIPQNVLNVEPLEIAYSSKGVDKLDRKRTVLESDTVNTIPEEKISSSISEEQKSDCRQMHAEQKLLQEPHKLETVEEKVTEPPNKIHEQTILPDEVSTSILEDDNNTISSTSHKDVLTERVADIQHVLDIAEESTEVNNKRSRRKRTVSESSKVSVNAVDNKAPTRNIRGKLQKAKSEDFLIDEIQIKPTSKQVEKCAASQISTSTETTVPTDKDYSGVKSKLSDITEVLEHEDNMEITTENIEVESYKEQAVKRNRRKPTVSESSQESVIEDDSTRTKRTRRKIQKNPQEEVIVEENLEKEEQVTSANAIRDKTVVQTEIIEERKEETTKRSRRARTASESSQGSINENAILRGRRVRRKVQKTPIEEILTEENEDQIMGKSIVPGEANDIKTDQVPDECLDVDNVVKGTEEPLKAQVDVKAKETKVKFKDNDVDKSPLADDGIYVINLKESANHVVQESNKVIVEISEKSCVENIPGVLQDDVTNFSNITSNSVASESVSEKPTCSHKILNEVQSEDKIFHAERDTEHGNMEVKSAEDQKEKTNIIAHEEIYISNEKQSDTINESLSKTEKSEPTEALVLHTAAEVEVLEERKRETPIEKQSSSVHQDQIIGMSENASDVEKTSALLSSAKESSVGEPLAENERNEKDKATKRRTKRTRIASESSQGSVDNEEPTKRRLRHLNPMSVIKEVNVNETDVNETETTPPQLVAEEIGGDVDSMSERVEFVAEIVKDKGVEPKSQKSSRRRAAATHIDQVGREVSVVKSRRRHGKHNENEENHNQSGNVDLPKPSSTSSLLSEVKITEVNLELEESPDKDTSLQNHEESGPSGRRRVVRKKEAATDQQVDAKSSSGVSKRRYVSRKKQENEENYHQDEQSPEQHDIEKDKAQTESKNTVTKRRYVSKKKQEQKQDSDNGEQPVAKHDTEVVATQPESSVPTSKRRYVSRKKQEPKPNSGIIDDAGNKVSGEITNQLQDKSDVVDAIQDETKKVRSRKKKMDQQAASEHPTTSHSPETKQRGNEDKAFHTDAKEHIPIGKDHSNNAITQKSEAIDIISPSNTDAELQTPQYAPSGAKKGNVIHSHITAESTDVDDTPGRRARNVPQRKAATAYHNYDETSDSEKPTKTKKKTDSPRKSLEVTKTPSTVVITAAPVINQSTSPLSTTPATTARGRTRKPTAKIQQFLEEERAKAETPKKKGLLAAATGSNATTPRRTPAKRGNRALAKADDVPGTPQTTKSRKKEKVTVATAKEDHNIEEVIVIDDEIEPHTTPPSSNVNKGRIGIRRAKLAEKDHNAEGEPPAKKSPIQLETDKQESIPAADFPTPIRTTGRRNAAAAAKAKIEQDAIATAAIDPPKKSRTKKALSKVSSVVVTSTDTDGGHSSEMEDDTLTKEEKGVKNSTTSTIIVVDDQKDLEVETVTDKPAGHKKGLRKIPTATTTSSPAVPAKRSRKAKIVEEATDVETSSETKSSRIRARGRKNVHFDEHNQVEATTSAQPNSIEIEPVPVETAEPVKRGTRIRRK